MKKKILPLIIATLIISLLNTGLLAFLTFDKVNEVIQNRPVVISTDYDKGQSMDKALKTGKPIIVWFYTDWCRYCQKLAPVFKKVVNKKEIKQAFAVAYVNAEDEANEALVKEYKVKGYPTVYVVNGNKKEYISPMDLFSVEAEKKLGGKFLKALGE